MIYRTAQKGKAQALLIGEMKMTKEMEDTITLNIFYCVAICAAQQAICFLAKKDVLLECGKVGHLGRPELDEPEKTCVMRVDSLSTQEVVKLPSEEDAYDFFYHVDVHFKLVAYATWRVQSLTINRDNVISWTMEFAQDGSLKLVGQTKWDCERLERVSFRPAENTVG